MKLPRRNFLHLAAGAVALPTVSRFAWAQAYPSRPVRVIVPFAPAGTIDILARVIGQWLSERLGQQVVIDNRPGGGGIIGTEAVVRASPDGYTLLLVTAANAINTTLYEKLNFSFIRDIAPVADIMVVPNVMLVNPSVPAKTIPELVAWMKQNDGRVTFGSSGNGTSSHLAAVMFQVATGTHMTHVPFRSTADEMNNMMGGSIQVAIDSMTTIWPLAQGGQVRALGKGQRLHGKLLFAAQS